MNRITRILIVLFILGSSVCTTNVLANQHTINLTFRESLETVDVEVKLYESASSLKARNTYSALFTKPARDCNSGELIGFSDSRLYLNSETRCINYSMRLLQKQDRRPFNLKSGTLVTTPAEWLFLPRLRKNDSVRINVDKPENFNLSVPWDVIDTDKHIYRLHPSPQSADGLLVIGDFKQENIQHKSTTMRVAYLSSKKLDYPMLNAWLKQTVDNVSLVYGRFPHPNPQIIISPTASAWTKYRSPVPFGRVVRDFGESVQFYIDQRQSLEKFNKDWTATHEFSHLLLPYVNWKNRWLSEGFASYYQNILMARSGMYSEQRAWQKLHDGFMRGKRSVPELSPNSAAREGRGGTMKVYWSGAALAFLADTRLRVESENINSLDGTLDELQKCCLPSTRSWSGSQLMRKLDQLSASNVFTELYSDYANSAEFIPFEEAYEVLGISIVNGKVKLSNDPEKSALRQSLMKK